MLFLSGFFQQRKMKVLRANDEGRSSSSGYVKDSCNNAMGTVKIQSRVLLLCNQKGNANVLSRE